MTLASWSALSRLNPVFSTTRIPSPARLTQKILHQSPPQQLCACGNIILQSRNQYSQFAQSRVGFSLIRLSGHLTISPLTSERRPATSTAFASSHIGPSSEDLGQAASLVETFDLTNASSNSSSLPPSNADVDKLLDEALKGPPSPEPKPDGLVIADSCVKRLKEISETRLRVVVEGGGCSGFQYKFELDGEFDPETDRAFEKEGIQVIIDESSLEFLAGSVVEYHTELIRSAFRISANPNAEKGCSCGASFSVKF